MKRKFQLQITIVVDTDHRHEIIENARKLYSENGGASSVDDDGTEHPLPAEEAVESIGDALIELMHTHPAFDHDGIELTEMTCDSEGAGQDLTEGKADAMETAAPSLDEDSAGENHNEDLDEFETGVYLCRWPNGEFSVVAAPSKREAIIALDEWAGAHPSQLHPLDSFMADFMLTDEGEIVLRELSEQTGDIVWDVCYPELRDVLVRDDTTDIDSSFKPGGRERVLDAVKHERTRLWENQPKDVPATELGKRIAKQMGTSAVVADYYAEQAAKRILESKEGEDGKAN